MHITEQTVIFSWVRKRDVFPGRGCVVNPRQSTRKCVLLVRGRLEVSGGWLSCTRGSLAPDGRSEGSTSPCGGLRTPLGVRARTEHRDIAHRAACKQSLAFKCPQRAARPATTSNTWQGDFGLYKHQAGIPIFFTLGSV